MKYNITFMCLTVGGLLTLGAGCGKTDQEAVPTPAADKTTSAPIAAPAQATETLLAQVTNAAAPASETAKTTVDATVKAADTAVTPVKEAAPKAVDAPSPATNPTPVSVDQAKTTLAGLSQGQMVQGLKDALAKGLQQAVASLGHDGGFLTNVNVKIPMPEKLQKVEKGLRAMKQENAYVTSKAMDGLFKMVAKEEQQIRQNPAARTTAMLQQVFGALKR